MRNTLIVDSFVVKFVNTFTAFFKPAITKAIAIINAAIVNKEYSGSVTIVFASCCNGAAARRKIDEVCNVELVSIGEVILGDAILCVKDDHLAPPVAPLGASVKIEVNESKIRATKLFDVDEGLMFGFEADVGTNKEN